MLILSTGVLKTPKGKCSGLYGILNNDEFDDPDNDDDVDHDDDDADAADDDHDNIKNNKYNNNNNKSFLALWHHWKRTCFSS